jgi:hypothetical protein
MRRFAQFKNKPHLEEKSRPSGLHGLNYLVARVRESPEG